MPGTLRYAYNIDDTVSKALLDSRAPTVFTYDAAYRRPTGWSRIQGGTWAQPACASGFCKVLDSESYAYAEVGTKGANKLSEVTTTTMPWPYAATATVTAGYAYDLVDWLSDRWVSTVDASMVHEAFTYDLPGRLDTNTNLLDAFTYAYSDATPRVTARASTGGPQIAAAYFPAQQDGLLQEHLHHRNGDVAGPVRLRLRLWPQRHLLHRLECWHGLVCLRRLQPASQRRATRGHDLQRDPRSAGNIGSMATVGQPTFGRTPRTNVTLSYDSGKQNDPRGHESHGGNCNLSNNYAGHFV